MEGECHKNVLNTCIHLHSLLHMFCKIGIAYKNERVINIVSPTLANNVRSKGCGHKSLSNSLVIVLKKFPSQNTLDLDTLSALAVMS
jgi:hypothetical protein